MPILLVDDEIAILDGLRRQLRKKFQVHTANSGAEALELLETESVAVVVSDMRMPQMDGATFLSRVRARHPDVVRILLTGQADTQAAITAVNEGQIYRFLTKPCPPEVLLIAEWRDGAAGALIMGIRHGAYCLGCCWALMAVLFVVGTMHLLWMAAIAGFVLAEKVAPRDLRVRYAAAAVLVGWGALTVLTAGA